MRRLCCKAAEMKVIRLSGLGDLLLAVVQVNESTGDISMILSRPGTVSKMMS